MIWFLLPLFLTSCTINIIQTDTHGVAEDVVDSDPSTKADTDVALEGLRP